MNARSPRIGVLGHYGNDNLGDEAITQAVIQNIRLREPEAEIVCFSVNPANTRQRHGVPAYAVSRQAQEREDRQFRRKGLTPSRSAALGSVTPPATGWKALLKNIPGLMPALRLARRLLNLPRLWQAEWRFIRASRERLKDMDLLLIAGSNQFLDNFGGVWAFPYAMLKWSLLGRLAGARVAFVSVGAGPIVSPISRLFVRLAMLIADATSFRDEASRELIRNGWSGQDASVKPDLAFSLQLPEAMGTGKQVMDRLPRIGLNPMPVHDGRYWHKADDNAYQRYVGQLARFCEHLQEQGYLWFFFATQPKDANVMVDVITMLRERHPAWTDLDERMNNPVSVDDLVRLIASADVLVSTRFHGVVLSLMAGRPALGICYHRKTADVLHSMGMGSYAVMLEEIESDDLARRLQRLLTDRDHWQKQIQTAAARYRAQLDDQYEQLLGLIPQKHRTGVRKEASPTKRSSP